MRSTEAENSTQAVERYPFLQCGGNEMSTLAESLGSIKRPQQWLATGGVVLLIWGVLVMSRRNAMPEPGEAVAKHTLEPYLQAPAIARAVRTQTNIDGAVPSPNRPPEALAGRKVIRTTSISMVVQHPTAVAEQIASLAEGAGGYLETAEGGGENATSSTLTLRVPAAQFERVRAEIRKLSVRVESEKVDAQDVTRQYADQDANIRNLHAEEAQYLAIMKQASTVKDMLAVSEQLSAVRGQIEQQEAEFNALSRQIETVAIAIALRTESEAQVSGLQWRPIYQLKLALRDGMESLANYAATMTMFLAYLPAALLWVSTIVIGMIASWRIVRWVGMRWFGWKVVNELVQN
jgi:hypothetical protein